MHAGGLAANAIVATGLNLRMKKMKVFRFFVIVSGVLIAMTRPSSADLRSQFNQQQDNAAKANNDCFLERIQAKKLWVEDHTDVGIRNTFIIHEYRGDSYVRKTTESDKRCGVSEWSFGMAGTYDWIILGKKYCDEKGNYCFAHYLEDGDIIQYEKFQSAIHRWNLTKSYEKVR